MVAMIAVLHSPRRTPQVNAMDQVSAPTGCYARAKRAKTGVVGDRGVSSVGDVDQLQGSRQLDHILVSRELLFTVTRLLNDGKDLMAMQWAVDAGGLLCGQPAGEHQTERVGAA